MENELLRDYFASLLSTNILSCDEFIKTLRDSNLEATTEQMKDWYSILQSQDELILNQTTEDMGSILTMFKEVNISEFLEREMKQYFTLETFINNLYDMGLLLDQKLAYVNSEIENYSQTLQNFYYELKSLGYTLEDDDNSAVINGMVEKLNKLKSNIKEFDE